MSMLCGLKDCVGGMISFVCEAYVLVGHIPDSWQRFECLQGLTRWSFESLECLDRWAEGGLSVCKALLVVYL